MDGVQYCTVIAMYSNPQFTGYDSVMLISKYESNVISRALSNLVTVTLQLDYFIKNREKFAEKCT